MVTLFICLLFRIIYYIKMISACGWQVLHQSSTLLWHYVHERQQQPIIKTHWNRSWRMHWHSTYSCVASSIWTVWLSCCNFCKSHNASFHQCSCTIPVRCVLDICPLLLQKLDNFQESGRGSWSEGIQFVPVFNIDIYSFFEKSLERFLASVTCISNKSGSGRRHVSNIASRCKLAFCHFHMVPTWLLCQLGSNKYDNQLQSSCNHVRYRPNIPVLGI